MNTKKRGTQITLISQIYTDFFLKHELHELKRIT